MVKVQVSQIFMLLATTYMLSSNTGNAALSPELMENCKVNCNTSDGKPSIKAVPLYCAVYFREHIQCENGTTEIANLAPVINAISHLDMGNILKTFSAKYVRTASDLYKLNEDDLDLEKATNSTGRRSRWWNRKRSKRDVILADNNFSVPRTRRKSLNHENEGTFVINGVNRASPQYYDTRTAVDINCQRVADKNYLVSIEDVDDQRVLMMNELDQNNLRQQLLFQTNAPNAISVEVFKIKEELFAFTTVRHDPQGVLSKATINTGSTLYRVNLADKTFVKTQTIHMPFAQSSAFWRGMGEEANDIFLAIAPSKTLTETGSTYDVMVPCYRWQGGYFDYVSQLPASNPQSINHFTMFSHDYLAVANYQNDEGATSIQSEIFKYQHSEAGFVSFQKIQTHGAKDIQHFTFESSDGRLKEHFIAIANNCKKDENGNQQFWVQSTIMKYGELRFMPFKSFYAYGAIQFLPVKHGNKFFLALADLHGIRMFQYNGWTFVQTHSIKYDSQKSSPFSLNLRQLSMDEQSYIVVASNEAGVKNGIFAVDFETRNDHRKLLVSVESWCQAAKDQIESRDLAEIEAAINSSPKVTDGKVTVQGTITFVKGVKIEDLKSQALRMGRSKSLGQHEFRTMSSNERRFRTLSQRMGMIHARMEHVIWTDQDQIVNGNFFLTKLIYENPNLQIKNLHVGTLSSVNVADHLENIVFLNKPQVLNGIVTETIQTLDLKVATVNGRLLADYALKNPVKMQVFTGMNEFISDVHITDAIQVTREFAGLSFSDPTFLLARGNQTFPGLTMKLSKSTVENLYTISLNNKDVFFYFFDAVPLSGGNIKMKKHFKNLEIRNAKAGSVNNVNIKSLFDNAIYTDKRRAQQSFVGPTYIESMIIREVKPANPKINEEFDLSRDFVNIETGSYQLKNVQVTRATDIQELFVSRQLNNINVINGKLDVLLESSPEPQHIKGKTLRFLTFVNHVKAEDLVDGVQLSTWSERLDIQLEETNIQGILSTTGLITFADNLDVSKSFSQGEADVLGTLQSIASTNDVMLPGSCDLQFENLEITRNSDIRGHVNGVEPSQWVVNSDSQEVTVTAEKTFTEGVQLDRDIRAQALYGTTERNENILEVLPTILLDGVEQTITHPLIFTGLVQVSRAACTNAILNEIPFENLLFKRGDQTIHVESIFRQSILTLEGASVLDDINADIINDIKFKEQLQDTLRTGKVDEVQVVSADYSFSDLITDNADVTGSFASSDVKTIFGNIVLKNQKEIAKLSANNLIFNGPVTLGLLDYFGQLNGISAQEWGKAWLLKHGDQIVNTKVAFEGPLEVNVMEAPSINNVDIQQLASDIVRIDSDEVIEGTLAFEDLVQANSGIVAPDGMKVNGIDLRRDVLLKSSPETQSILGNKRFMNGMSIFGNLFVKTIPNFDIANFVDLLNPDQNSINENPSSLVVNGKLKLEHEPGFDSSFNEWDWNELSEKFWLRDRDVMLHQLAEFSSLTLSQGGSMDATAKLNGMNLQDFERNYASKSRDQEWTGTVALQNVDQINNLIAPSVVIKEGNKFNGVDVETFYDSVLRYSGDQNIHGTLRADNVETGRFDTADGATVNSHELGDFMTVSGSNELTTSKNFDKIVVKTIHLSPETVIDGVEMGQWNEHAVRRSGTQSLMGPVRFSELETNDNVVVDGLVDGVKYDLDNIFTTDTDQEIFGNVMIISDENMPAAAALTAPAGLSVEGNLNGINVQDSISKLVFKNAKEETPIVIKTKTEFDAPVVLSQVKTEALVQGHDVAEMISRFARAEEEVSWNQFSAREQYQDLLNIADRMRRVSNRRAIFLDHFVLTQTIRVPSTYVKVLRKVGYPAIAIGFKKSSQVVTENWWSYSSVVDYYQLQIGNRVQLEGTIADIAELRAGKDHLFAFAVNSDENNGPANTALEVVGSINNFEINKSPGKHSKAFILKSVEVGTPNVRPAISQVIYSNGFTSLHAFSVGMRDGRRDCIAASTRVVDETESPLKLYCLDGDGKLNAAQEIHIDSPTMMTSVTANSQTLLGILSRSSSGRPEGLLEMWKNPGGTSVTFTKHHCLPVFNAVGLDSISSIDESLTFLAVASGALRKSRYQGSVFIYRYSEFTEQFQKVQTIASSHPIDVKLQWLRRSNEMIMYILSESVTNNVQVYKYQGLSGWNLVHQFTSENGKSIEVTDFILDGLYRAQLLVTSPTETNIYSAEFMGIVTVVEESMESMREEGTKFSARLDTDNL